MAHELTVKMMGGGGGGGNNFFLKKKGERKSMILSEIWLQFHYAWTSGITRLSHIVGSER